MNKRVYMIKIPNYHRTLEHYQNWSKGIEKTVVYDLKLNNVNKTRTKAINIHIYKHGMLLT